MTFKTVAAIDSYREAIRLNPNHEEAGANLIDAESELQNGLLKTKRNNSIRQDILFRVAVSFIGIAVLVCFVAEIGFVYLSGRDYFGPKNTIIFEPDYSKITSIDSSALEKTAEILTERSHHLKYSSISFVVTDDKQIVGKIPGYVDTNALIKRISPIGLLEFVDFGKTPLPEGTVISTDLENKYLQQTDEKHWHTVMTNNGIEQAILSRDQTGSYQISFSLTNEGKKIFADYTASNIGTYLGIVLDKVIISVPVIQAPITDGQGMISGAFTQESAQDLATMLRTTPLPIPILLIQNADSVK